MQNDGRQRAGESLAVYIHVPFCAKHCAYCDFNTYVLKQGDSAVDRTVDAICADIESSAQLGHGRIVSSIFFGGGTPTFLSSDQIVRVLQSVRNSFTVAANAEISSEANPGSSDIEKFAAMRASGFNRLSIGVQSFNDELLVKLDRFHTTAEAERALAAARTAGFTNMSLDLMFGLPGQTLELWRQTLQRACDHETEHLSLYALTLEPGTRFERMHSGGRLQLPDEDTELEMYESSIEYLTGREYQHYEVSNFAKPGFRCSHNLVYWHNQEYLGFGPGAVSYFGGRRFKREKLPARYACKVESATNLEVEGEELDAVGQLGETMILGLRLLDGLDTREVATRTGIDPLQYFEKTIAQQIDRGLLTLNGTSLALTNRGLLLANVVLSEFV